LPTSSSTSRAVAEVLNESAVISLHSRCGRCVAVTHGSIDHIEATLSLVQPQLDVGAAASRKVLCPPFNVENPVGSTATYRSEYAEPGVDQIQVVPVRIDGVVVGTPRQADVSKRRIGSQELGIAIGRQIDARENRAVQGIREGQRDGSHRIISVIANVRGAWHDTAPYLGDRVVAHARCRCSGSRRGWRGCWRRGWCWTSGWRRP
jgi:hypothetical protein